MQTATHRLNHRLCRMSTAPCNWQVKQEGSTWMLFATVLGIDVRARYGSQPAYKTQGTSCRRPLWRFYIVLPDGTEKPTSSVHHFRQVRREVESDSGRVQAS